jgi:hypothetical protein
MTLEKFALYTFSVSARMPLICSETMIFVAVQKLRLTIINCHRSYSIVPSLALASDPPPLTLYTRIGDGG